MKILLLSLLLLISLHADQGDWDFERINIYLENDAEFDTDVGYSDGGKFSALLYRPNVEGHWLRIPFTEDLTRSHFISFSAARQMFTPDDLDATEVVEDERPYAGWFYYEMGLHQSSQRHLDSLIVQVGVLGPASLTEAYQKYIHKLLGVSNPAGWEHQLRNEIGLQLNYQHKWRFVPTEVWGVESSIIPYAGGEFGNIAIKANSGVSLRIGWNIPEDFDTSFIDDVGESGIPVHPNSIPGGSKIWSFNFNLSAGGSFVARDVFLDGNTFTDSHSVEKNLLRAYGRYGFSARYKSFILDYHRVYNTEHYKTQGYGHKYGAIYFSYLY